MKHTLVPFENILNNWIGLEQFLNVPTYTQPSFPPYNITHNSDNKYCISVALAGYNMNDVTVERIENKLHIYTVPTSELTNSPDNDTDTVYMHRGIAKRSFKLQFNLSPEIKVDTATFVDGMLSVNMHREIPEEKLPKKIPITSGGLLEDLS